MKRTGTIWLRPARSRGQIVRRVCEALGRAHGTPRLGNPRSPTDDLVYIIISNKTSPTTARDTYRRMKRAFPTWDALVDSPASRVRSILKPAGLSRVKSAQLRAALRRVRSDLGRCDLRRLRGRGEAAVREYLTSLPGVSDKVAKCVMMYAMGAGVLPVDTHVHRIALRLGWTARRRADQCHDELEALVPPTRRFAFHVDCVCHGRAVCRGARPRCESCCIRRWCAYDPGTGDG